MAGGLLPIVPLGHFAYRAFSGVMPEADQRVFADDEIQATFLDDLAGTARGRFQALVDDARLIGEGLGFPAGRREGVGAMVAWRADPIVSFDAAKAAAARLPDAELVLRPGESHLGGSPPKTRFRLHRLVPPIRTAAIPPRASP